jgi:hypothetical protein
MRIQNEKCKMNISKLKAIPAIDLFITFAFCNLHYTFPYNVIIPEKPRNARAINPVRTKEMGSP